MKNRSPVRVKRLSPLTAAVASAIAVTSPTSAKACAGCRNPSLPTAEASAGPLKPGALRTGSSLSGTFVHVVHPSGCDDLDNCDEVPVQPAYLHDQTLLPVELRLSAEYGLSDAFSVELQLPFRSVTSTIEFTTQGGAPTTPLDPDVHHRDETLVGPGDALLQGAAGGLLGGFWLGARFGFSLPLAHTEEDPFELGDRGERHQHVQFGTGTFDPTLTLEAAKRQDSITFQWFAQAQASFYENSHGYLAPFRVQSALEASYAFSTAWSGKAGVGAFHEEAERWQGVIRQDGSLGRSELYLSFGVSHAWDETVLRLGGRLPLCRQIIVGSEPAGEFSSPLTLQVALSQVWEP